jgi:hypothetical protein
MFAAQSGGMSMRKLVLILGLLLAALSAACGGNGDGNGNGTGDTTDGGVDMRSLANQGKACVTDEDCGSDDYRCSYPVADGCSAKGECRAVQEPTCTAISFACGCDGQPVPNSGCFYDSGFAGGPIVPGIYPDGCLGHGAGDAGL